MEFGEVQYFVMVPGIGHLVIARRRVDIEQSPLSIKTQERDLGFLALPAGAAFLALTATMGSCIAFDEKRRFRRRAVELIGEAKILRTKKIIVEAIQQNHISVQQADMHKATFANNNYGSSHRSPTSCRVSPCLNP
jgi:hypothetical protein